MTASYGSAIEELINLANRLGIRLEQAEDPWIINYVVKSVMGEFAKWSTIDPIYECVGCKQKTRGDLEYERGENRARCRMRKIQCNGCGKI